jgi:L-rhamnose isomerase
MVSPWQMRALERSGDASGRPALIEALKGPLFGAAWDYFCLTQGVPVGVSFMNEIRVHWRTVLSKRA